MELQVSGPTLNTVSESLTHESLAPESSVVKAETTLMDRESNPYHQLAEANRQMPDLVVNDIDWNPSEGSSRRG
ncbi:hypothetical protein ACFLVF_00315 [Chloroflexota bacterium]